VSVTATNAGGSTTASSNPTAVIDQVSAPPVVSPPSGGGGGSSSGGGGGSFPDLSVALSADQATAPAAGSEVVYRVTVADKLGFGGSFDVRLTFNLPQGYTVTNTYSDRGKGCAGSLSPLVCDLDWVSPLEDGHVVIWGKVGQLGPQVLTASVTEAPGKANLADNNATLTLQPASQVAPPPGNSPAQNVRQLTRLVVTGVPRERDALHAKLPTWSIRPSALSDMTIEIA
jgi:hypothetical protein